MQKREIYGNIPLTQDSMPINPIPNNTNSWNSNTPANYNEYLDDLESWVYKCYNYFQRNGIYAEPPPMWNQKPNSYDSYVEDLEYIAQIYKELLPPSLNNAARAVVTNVKRRNIESGRGRGMSIDNSRSKKSRKSRKSKKTRKSK